MDVTVVALAIVLGLILAAEFINGWTDAPNAIATVISTGTLSPRTAIAMAMALNIGGAFIGTQVAVTIGKGIIRPEAVDLTTVGAAAATIVAWGIFAWRLGLPISKSHALVAGLSGAGLAIAGPSVLLIGGWLKVIAGLFFSTILGSGCGWFIAKVIQMLFSNYSPQKCHRTFGVLQVFSAASMALSHGSNDGQKFIGAFALALFLGGVTTSFSIPWWVIVLCALVMGIGTSVGGMRIIRTMGFRIVKLQTYQGFAAETSAASTIMVASIFGIPLSTTHTISTAIVGVGIARRASAVRWSVVEHIVYAWLLTFPVCGLLSYIVALAVRFVTHAIF